MVPSLKSSQKGSGLPNTTSHLILLRSARTARKTCLAASSSSSLPPNRSPSLGCTRTLHVHRGTRESLQSITRFSASVWPLHHCTGKVFGSHNKSLSINSEITKRPYLPEITIKESCPSNTALLHKTLLALQKPSRIFCFASPT